MTLKITEQLILGDCKDHWLENTYDDIVILDPPFDKWKEVSQYDYKTLIAFTNFQNREHVTNMYGTPRVELIWHFKDGRWVSNNFPRLNHESILIYGELGNSFVGEYNKDRKPQKKGKGCIGKDKNLGNRIYKPKERKMLSSVLEYPRNMRSKLGTWSKPETLIRNLLEWLAKDGDRIYDPYMGSGTVRVIARELGLKYFGVEINQKHFEIASNR